MAGGGHFLFHPAPILLSRVVIEQPIFFDDMQSRALRRAEPVDHGKGTGLDAHRVDDQRVAFVMATESPYQDGVTFAGCCAFMRMWRT